MEDLLEGNDVQDPKMVSRIVRAAFQKADYPLRERIHCLTSENKLNWLALKSGITSMLLPDPVETMIQDFHEVARDDLAPSEKFERIKALMSSPTDRLAYWMCSIGYPLAFRAQHHAASIEEQMDHPANDPFKTSYIKKHFDAPYSPQLNTCEGVFSVMKARVRSYLEQACRPENDRNEAEDRSPI
ncbi:hypothetical protein Ciccas_009283 [Cichlidogyrus casuarinus]|uniref:Uncharacterized protein n=1 Tax=Cichlidogyrus casuarinus TaxID=1844966 RepID=A0ABD2PXX3_9PLAT